MPRRPVHWHAFLTHFPLSLFSVAFLFQIAHFFYARDCLELGTVVTFTGGTISMVPAIVSGWFTWKRYYAGARSRIFRRKIQGAFAMLFVSIGTTGWRLFFYATPYDIPGTVHVVYALLVTSLVIGAVAEGYLGGSLRPSRPRTQTTSPAS